MKAFLFRRYNTANAISIFVLLGTLIPFIGLCFFVHPSFIDDYCFADKTIEQGVLNAFMDWYNGWCGRYSLCFIMSINPLVFRSFFMYQALIFLMIILFPLLFFLLARTILSNQNNSLAIQTTALFTYLFFFQLPSVNEGLYWMTGAIAYQLPSLCLMLFLMLLADYRLRKQRTVLSYCGMIVLIIVLVGTNEISMATFLVFMVLLFLYSIWVKQPFGKDMFFLLGVTFVASLVVLIAPGNLVREELFPLSHDIVRAAQMTILGMGFYCFKWLGMTCFVSAIGVFVFKLQRIDILAHKLSIPFWMSISFFIIILLAGFFVPAWATGQMPNPRAINVLYFIFLLGVFYHIALVSQELETASMNKIAVISVVFGLFFITFQVGRSKENNIKTAYVDILSGKASRYDEAMSSFYKIGRVSELSQESSPASLCPVLENFSQSYTGCPEQYFVKHYR